MNHWHIFMTDPARPGVFPLAALVLLLLASGGVWTLYFSGRFRSALPESELAPHRPGMSFPAVALMMFLVANSLWGKFQAGAQPPRKIEVDFLQWQCLENLIVWALLLGSLLLVPGISLKDYGIRFRGSFRQLGIGGLAFLASLLPVYTLLIATSPLRTEETLHPLLHLLQTAPNAETVFWTGLMVVVVAPLMEEMIYRVILQTSLAYWLPVRVAIPLAAGIFCAVHGWPDMIPLLPLALVLGWVYHHHQSYLAAVMAHSLFNAWMLAWALLVPAGG